MAAAGASISDFIYVFIAVYGLTRLYSFYEPAIPYVLLLGMLFLFYTGKKTIRSKVDLEHLDDKNIMEMMHIHEKGGLHTGFMINFLNPTSMIGWLSSSFFVVSLVAALGLNAGGLNIAIDQNLKEINSSGKLIIENHSGFSSEPLKKTYSPDHDAQPNEQSSRYPGTFHLIISICFAFFLSVGCAIELILLAWLISRFRHRINHHKVNKIVSGMGYALILIGLFFGFMSVRMLLHF
jgi:threonine/homoserine/homoserine lactone efflux protein